MQTIQEPDVLQQPFCENGDKNTIPSTATGSQLASLAEGFPLITQQPTSQGGVPPERKDFNGAFNLLSKYDYAIQNGWLPTFKTEVSNAIGGYAEGACLWYMPSTGTYAGQVLMLKSLVANNTYDFTANPDGYIGTYWQIVTSAGGGGGLPLLTPIWSDHLLNDASYLRADTFSWQSGNVYISAYQHLVDDVNGITSETETVAGTTITFYRATDGHKVVLADQESNVATIFNATGIAWYYILDTTNQRFKLPRSKWNFVGLRDSVGGYVAPGLPNITGAFATGDGTYAVGAFYHSGIQAGNTTAGGENDQQILFDASRSSAIYGNSTTVQPPATQAYLYFYVGNTVQNETSVDVGEMTEALNNKADLDLSNVTNTGKSTAAGWAMPSSVYEDLILAASDNYYVAPSNGYFVIDKQANGANQYIEFISHLQVGVFIPQSGYHGRLSLPVIKGEQIRVLYNAGGTTQMFRFYYAEGSKSEQ